MQSKPFARGVTIWSVDLSVYIKIRVFRPFSLLGWYQFPWRIWQCLMDGVLKWKPFSSHSNQFEPFQPVSKIDVDV